MLHHEHKFDFEDIFKEDGENKDTINTATTEENEVGKVDSENNNPVAKLIGRFQT